MSLSGLSLGLAPLERFARNTAFAFGKNGRQFTFASPQHRQGSSAANLDNVWNPDLWKPTATANDHLIDGKVVKPTEEDFDQISKKIVKCTEDIRRDPYDTNAWVRRAAELQCLGYPNLAAGDAYKAKLKLDEVYMSVMMNLPNDDLRAQISTREMFKMQFEASYGLASALTFADDLKSLLALGENGKKQCPQMSLFTDIYDRAVKLCINKNQTIGYSPSTSTDTALKRECGFIKHLAYSFIPLKYLSRSDDLIESTKDLFRAASSSCMLSQSQISSQSSNVLGVFATRAIKFSEAIIQDTPIFAASNISNSAPWTQKSTKLKITNICENCYGRIPPLSRPTQSTCCSTVYCHLNCQEIALASYHKVLCGQNFDWLYQEGAKKPGHLGLNGPMWLRILAACIQSDCHPLDHPSIANLSPLYDDYSRLWSLSNNIVTPIKILRQLGIDVYSDMRYDTWVLQTVWARVINNQQGDSDKREWHLRGSINSIHSSITAANPIQAGAPQPARRASME